MIFVLRMIGTKVQSAIWNCQTRVCSGRVSRKRVDNRQLKHGAAARALARRLDSVRMRICDVVDSHVHAAPNDNVRPYYILPMVRLTSFQS